MVDTFVLAKSFVTLLVITDPVGVVPVFLAITADATAGERNRAAWQAVAVAALVIATFAVFGQQILVYLGISVPSLQVAGGLLLAIALDLLRGETERLSGAARANVAFVPLGTPLLAGPGAIATIMIFIRQAEHGDQRLGVALGLLGVLAVLYLSLRFAGLLQRILHQAGIDLVARISRPAAVRDRRPARGRRRPRVRTRRPLTGGPVVAAGRPDGRAIGGRRAGREPARLRRGRRVVAAVHVQPAATVTHAVRWSGRVAWQRPGETLAGIRASLGGARMRERQMDVHVVALDTHVGQAVKAYAREKMAGLAKVAPAPVLYARVTLGRAADPAVARPAIADALLDLSGRPVRAQVSARLLDEAVDLLEARLRHRLEHLASQRRTLHRSAGVAEPGEWRRADLPTHQPAWFPRPPGERQVVRHKTFARQPLSAEEAAGELALLDYDFHLFTEASTSRDAVLWRRPEGTFGLSVAGPQAPDLAGCTIPVEPQPPPTARTERQAIELLDLTDAPFVFFVDTSTGRGAVVYRRFDGHYGLLTPAA